MEKSETWISETFKSVQNQKLQEPNSDLYFKIEQRIQGGETKVFIMPIWKVAVASIVVILANAFAVKKLIFTQKSMNIVEYQLGTNHNFYANK